MTQITTILDVQKIKAGEMTMTSNYCWIISLQYKAVSIV